MTGEWAYSAEYDRPQEVLSLYRRHATELMPAEWVRRRMHRFYFQCAIAVMVLSVLPGLAATVANSAYKFGFGLTHNLDVGKSLYPEAPRTAAAQVQGDTIWPFLVAALFFAAVVMPVAVRRRRRKLRGTRLSERIVVHDGKHGTPTRLLAVWERAVELRRDINVADFLTMAPRLTDTQAEAPVGDGRGDHSADRRFGYKGRLVTDVPVEPVAVTGTRTELEVAADTVAALFGAHVLEMTRGRVSGVSIATGVPVAAVHQAWRRWDAGRRCRPSGQGCDDTSRRPSCKADPGRPRPNPKRQAIPDDATKWVCSKKNEAKGEPQPIDCFEVRADTGTRRTICKECRRQEFVRADLRSSRRPAEHRLFGGWCDERQASPGVPPAARRPPPAARRPPGETLAVAWGGWRRDDERGAALWVLT